MTTDMTIEMADDMSSSQINQLIKQGICPYCGSKMQPDGGCWFCPVCTYSVCG